MTPPDANTMTPTPTQRRLRAFAFDPILSRDIDTYEINDIKINLPWEDVEPGPVDNYMEIVDYDPPSQAFYAPVDLNDKNLLAQDGLPPSEGNPQFHQQMVYAVTRTTIAHFERALGRQALWSPLRIRTQEKDKFKFVPHLRIYPHALREANAYYSPNKKALLFGYFPASSTDPGENMPGEIIFTCLSHDIVAHETSHALLDGLHRRFIEPSNMDVWAIHEAFADIVALFQHFTYPEVLHHQIAKTRGKLENQNLLGELAYQFGQAIEQYGALRSAIGKIDPVTKKWIPEKPDPLKILQMTEPHDRGAIMVAAVFDAFLTIYKRRIADLLRIATGGTGVLPPGDLHPDLVNRLAQEASKAARHILHICIRALDYCPPVDVDFGDYLRAMITADYDLVSDDRLNYRLALIEAFRERGIYPRDVSNLSQESLLWHKPNKEEAHEFTKMFKNPEKLREIVSDWGLSSDRKKIYDQTEKSRRLLHGWFIDKNAIKAMKAAHIVLDKDTPEAFYRKDGIPTLEVHSVRPARRIGPKGQHLSELVIEMTQRRRGYYDPKIQKEADKHNKNPPEPDFIFRGGCTMLVNPETTEVRYCIYKNILSTKRLDRMRKFLLDEEELSLRTAYFGEPKKTYYKGIINAQKGKATEIGVEPFALLHRSFEPKEVV